MERELFGELVQSLKEAAVISRTGGGDGKRSLGHTGQTLLWLQREPTHCAEILNAALETGDTEDFVASLRLVIDANGGVTKFADETGLNRETPQRTLSRKGNPQLSNLLPILQAAGLRLTVRAV